MRNMIAPKTRRIFFSSIKFCSVIVQRMTERRYLKLRQIANLFGEVPARQLSGKFQCDPVAEEKTLGGKMDNLPVDCEEAFFNKSL
jgi:hypothetical protein